MSRKSRNFRHLDDYRLPNLPTNSSEEAKTLNLPALWAEHVPAADMYKKGTSPGADLPGTADAGDEGAVSIDFR